ncbi:Uncharacterised protein [Vibrio cholerae]|nr:Uncharacterised protein [Vibrio cholerae]
MRRVTIGVLVPRLRNRNPIKHTMTRKGYSLTHRWLMSCFQALTLKLAGNGRVIVRLQ